MGQDPEHQAPDHDEEENDESKDGELGYRRAPQESPITTVWL